MVPLGLAAVGVITQLGQPVVIVLERGLALFQKLGDEVLFALLYRLLLGKEFFNVICFAFVRHRTDFTVLLRQAAEQQGLQAVFANLSEFAIIDTWHPNHAQNEGLTTRA